MYFCLPNHWITVNIYFFLNFFIQFYNHQYGLMIHTLHIIVYKLLARKSQITNNRFFVCNFFVIFYTNTIRNVCNCGNSEPANIPAELTTMASHFASIWKQFWHHWINYNTIFLNHSTNIKEQTWTLDKDLILAKQ